MLNIITFPEPSPPGLGFDDRSRWCTSLCTGQEQCSLGLVCRAVASDVVLDHPKNSPTSLVGPSKKWDAAPAVRACGRHGWRKYVMRDMAAGMAPWIAVTSLYM
ncbi:hypothetical protein NL676_028979 [Syzygium grande]|nr:hypothetical protein NL676_028979 [Syzygium grande]